MKVRLASLALSLLTLALLLHAIFAATGGLRALTSAALPGVKAHGHPIVHLPLRSSSGETFAMQSDDTTLRVVEITYVRCRTICTAQGANLAEVFRAFLPQVEAARLRFVSLSVDPEDCPDAIASRVHRLSSDTPGWDGACVADRHGLEALHAQLGVIAIRDKLGEFRHTEGIFLLDPSDHVIAYQASLDKQTLALTIQRALRGRFHD